MLELLIALVVGMLIGWSFPQPAWVARLVAKIRAKVDEVDSPDTTPVSPVRDTRPNKNTFKK